MGITQYTGAAVGSWMQDRNGTAAAVHSGNCSEKQEKFLRKQDGFLLCGRRLQ